MNKKPQVAIIGIGRWGKNLYAAFKRQGADIPYCFHKGKKENVYWLREQKSSTEIAESYEKILLDHDIQTIAIATPIATHFELAQKAFMAGKHVFLEKPGTENAESMKIICAESKKAGRKLAVGFVFVYHPVCMFIKKSLADEELKSIRMEWNKWGTFEESLSLNLLSHEISILTVLGIEIDLATIDFKRHPVLTPCDILDIKAKDVNGHDITIHINRISCDKRKSVTVITNQKIYVWKDEDLFVSTERQPYSKIILPTDKALDIEISDFLSFIRDDKVITTNGEFAVRVLKILDGFFN